MAALAVTHLSRHSTGCSRRWMSITHNRWYWLTRREQSRRGIPHFPKMKGVLRRKMKCEGHLTTLY